jgi:6-pyruvoyltetrahydropterin/6-carboxytetrahydropterin synthase
MKLTVTRIAHFNAAHRLHNPNWSDEKNAEFYGKCNNKNYHGHNYKLLVHVTGEVNPETGFVIDLKKLKHIIKIKIENRFDHKNLNLDTEEFKSLIPTAENIAVVIWNLLKQDLNDYKLKVTLYETERNYVEYCGEPNP